MVNQEQIEAVWDAHGVMRFGQDMTNECRLAAAIVGLKEELARTQAAHAEAERALDWIAQQGPGFSFVALVGRARSEARKR